MRALWVDAGNDADWEKVQREKMTALYYPVTDPIGDVKRRVADTSVRGYTSGVYMAWNWPQFSGLTGVGMAEMMHSLVAQVEQGGVPVKVQFDYEDHPPDPPDAAVQIRGMLSRWRALRPKQDTSWTLEGGQGGWMTTEFVQAIIALKIRVVPQLYSGSMGQNWCPLARVRDLTKRGFPDALVSPFYDAAAIDNYLGAEGFFFTQGRLP